MNTESLPPLQTSDIKELVQEETMSENKHPHICNIRLWANDCENTSQPWDLWEYAYSLDSNIWEQCTSSTSMFVPSRFYRRKTVKIFVNDIEVKLGISKDDDIKGYSTFYVPSLTQKVIKLTREELDRIFASSNEFNPLLVSRLIYLKESDAITRCNAMLSFTAEIL